MAHRHISNWVGGNKHYGLFICLLFLFVVCVYFVLCNISLKCRKLHATADSTKCRRFDVLQSTVANVQVWVRQQVRQLLARQRAATSADQGRSVQAEIWPAGAGQWSVVLGRVQHVHRGQRGVQVQTDGWRVLGQRRRCNESSRRDEVHDIRRW